MSDPLVLSFLCLAAVGFLVDVPVLGVVMLGAAALTWRQDHV